MTDQTPPPPPTPTVSIEDRQQRLAEAVRGQVAQGARVESQNAYDAVVVKGKDTNHVLHLILSLVTLGLWIPVWAGVAIFGGERRRLVSVDQYGNTSVQKL